jgi:hypothetical protein
MKTMTITTALLAFNLAVAGFMTATGRELWNFNLYLKR